MALIGGSNILFLDEPSTGLDPIAKRHILYIIILIIKYKDFFEILYQIHYYK